jgi:glutamyl endopeptidase
MARNESRKTRKASKEPQKASTKSTASSRSATADGSLESWSDAAIASARGRRSQVTLDPSRILPELLAEDVDGEDSSPSLRRRPGRKAVIGTDDRRQITVTTQYPYSAICQLEIDWRSKPDEIGTGCLIAPRLVLTAAHCVYDRSHQQFAAQIRVSPGRNGSDTVAPQTSSKLFVNRLYPSAGEGEKPQFDYAAILLDQPFRVGEFGVGVYGDEEFNGDTFNIVGYPFDKPRGTMWGHAQALSVVGPRILEYLIDTEPGQSGAPVFDMDTVNGQVQYVVVGIHSGASSSGNNIATRITEEVWENLEAWLQRAV